MAARQRSRRHIGRILAGIFAVAIVCGGGPGILLVNKPEAVNLAGIKLPYLYAWGLLWYFIEAACVVLAYLLVWRHENGE